MLSQSVVKSFESASCYRKWHAEYTGELSRFENEFMRNGSYFEYLGLGSGSGKSEPVTDLPRLANGRKSAAQERIEKQADKFKQMFDPANDLFVGWEITTKQLHMQYEGIEGTLDFIKSNGTDFRLSDLKLTADIENEYSYWSNPEEMDHLQPATYCYLYSNLYEFTDEFDYWVFDYSPKMNILNVNVTVSDEAINKMLERFSSTDSSMLEYNLLDEYPRIPSIAACRYCKLQCGIRINKASYNRISITI